MQAIMETAFDALYLVTVITLGIKMIVTCKGNSQFRLFGLMAVVLGAGDAFHLIPRAWALCTTGLENYTVALGMGKWITSITMTVFLCSSLLCMAAALPCAGQKYDNCRCIRIGGFAYSVVYDAAKPVAQCGGAAFLGRL